MSKPRVLQILHSDAQGGVLTLATLIAEGLRQRGIIVDTHSLYPVEHPSTLTKLGCCARMVWQLARADHDVLIAYQTTASLIIGVFGRLFGFRRRIVHQTALPQEVGFAGRTLDRIAGALGFYTDNIANTAFTRRAFDRYPNSYRRALRLIAHGVSLPPPKANRSELRRNFALPDEAFVVLNIGRLTRQKNQDVIIRALPVLPRAHLVIAGGGPREAEYRTLAASLGVADRLHLLGDVDRGVIGDLLAAADAFVFPSTWESFGIAAVEAAMAGLPIIASDLPVLREVLMANGAYSPRFVTVHDGPGWARAIQAMATDADPASPASYGEKMRHTYAPSRMIDAYVALLGRAAGAGSGDL